MTSSRTGQIGLLALAALAVGMGKDLAKLGGGYEAPARQDPEGWKRKRWQKPPSSGRHAPKVKLRIPGDRR